MKSIFNTLFSTLIVICFGISSCQKYLDAKPDKSLITPQSISDFQLMLDAYDAMNGRFPLSSDILSDNYYLLSSDWASMPGGDINRNLYLWIADENGNNDWANPYSTIMNTNIILYELPKISFSPSETAAKDNVEGSALFYRAYSFYGLAQLFGKPSDKTTSVSDLGICLRLASDFNQPSTRATVSDTYRQIISDLQRSVPLLPVRPLKKTRPSKAAAYGALSKAYLAMQEYDSAGRYADLCLQSYGADSLIDFNSLSQSAPAPFTRFNREVIIDIVSPGAIPLTNSYAKIDSNLFNSYASDDLRKTTFYKANTGSISGTYQFKGDYAGVGTSTGFVWAGIAVDEMYLIRAESYARAGNISAAMADLNKLMKSRWRNTVSYPQITALNADDALQKVLTERRKELYGRGTRWTDLRRLMKEPLLAITPKRLINNQIYQLQPNSIRFTMKIPLNVIQLSGIPQNE